MSKILESPNVLIAAGGTRESIDDVRYIGNFSGGALGHALAEQYANFYCEEDKVALLSPKSVPDRYGHLWDVNHENYTDAQSLQTSILSRNGVNLILHAAAVADYTPKPTIGKISSDQDELIIRLKKVPKILPMLRKHFGKHTTIVGFKLLSNVPEDKLIAVARKQILDCNTDYCIANDLQDISTNSRKIHIVDSSGDYMTYEGDTKYIAKKIVENIPIGNNYE